MLRSKIKSTGGEALRDHGTQIGANGSSQNDSNRLPVKFQVNRTSDDRTSKLDIFYTVNQVKHRRDPKQLQNSNKSPWLVLSNAEEALPQISGHSDIV
ncbi:hypothetical protein AAC387_Pa05g0804 [Persea americana]